MSKKLTTEDFIKKARLVHGDTYDYSKTEYVHSKTKIIVICPEHGEFHTTPNAHLRGSKCPRCSKPVHNLETFIEQARLIHGDRYDYSKVDYVKSLQHVTIICPEHGEFAQKPSQHLRGNGCPLCARKNVGLKVRISQEEALQKLKDIRGDKFDYSKVKYNKTTGIITLICPEHGEFQISYYNAVDSRTQEICPKCQYGGHLRNVEDFIERSQLKHGNKYDYNKVTWEQITNGKVCIICPEHGEFWQSYPSHLRGYGCRVCGQNNKKDSIGELEIANILNNFNIEYKQQFAIHSIVNSSGYLYVDFYIESLNTIIEFNGEQHYRPIEWFGGEEQFKKQQARDAELRQYCKDNNINLIEIQYDEDVWEILNNKLCK